MAPRPYHVPPLLALLRGAPSLAGGSPRGACASSFRSKLGESFGVGTETGEGWSGPASGRSSAWQGKAPPLEGKHEKRRLCAVEEHCEVSEVSVEVCVSIASWTEEMELALLFAAHENDARGDAVGGHVSVDAPGDGERHGSTAFCRDGLLDSASRHERGTVSRSFTSARG